MPFKIAILDDSLTDIKAISQELNRYNQIVDMQIEHFQNYRNKEILTKHFDLYILDIDISDVNGINIAKEIEKLHPKSTFIFYSNREDLVFDTYAVNCIFFIRKPHLEEDTRKAIKKIIILNKTLSKIFRLARKNIPLFTIVYIEAHLNNVSFHLINNEMITIRKSLKSISDQFEQNNFVVIDHGIMVNLHCIDKIDEGEFKVYLFTKMHLYVSKRKLKPLLERYYLFLLEK